MAHMGAFGPEAWPWPQRAVGCLGLRGLEVEVFRVLGSGVEGSGFGVWGFGSLGVWGLGV